MERKTKHIGLFATFLFAFVLLFAVGSKDVKASIDPNEGEINRALDTSGYGTNAVVVKDMHTLEKGEVVTLEFTISTEDSSLDNLEWSIKRKVGEIAGEEAFESITDYPYEVVSTSTYYKTATKKAEFKVSESGEYGFFIRIAGDNKNRSYNLKYDWYSNKYKSMNANAVSIGNDNYRVDINLGEYDGTYGSKAEIFREDTATGEIKFLGESHSTSTTNSYEDPYVENGKTFRYYAVNNYIWKQTLGNPSVSKELLNWRRRSIL